MQDGRSRWRRDLGTSAAIWAAGGRHEVTDGRWLALSGARSVDYNVACCHGPATTESSGPEAVADTIAVITELRAPALIMLAGAAVGDARPLIDAGWVTVGATPFMMNSSPAGVADAAVAPVQPGSSAFRQARQRVEEAFVITSTLAGVAVPDDPAATVPGAQLWALSEDGDVQACVLTVPAGDSLAIWSMATAPDRQRRGYGRRLLSAALADAAARGVRRSVLTASPPGFSLYQGLGYEVVEHWQLWSRPRWVLGRG